VTPSPFEQIARIRALGGHRTGRNVVGEHVVGLVEHQLDAVDLRLRVGQ
jgi:hypothetical protein